MHTFGKAKSVVLSILVQKEKNIIYEYKKKNTNKKVWLLLRKLLLVVKTGFLWIARNTDYLWHM